MSNAELCDEVLRREENRLEFRRLDGIYQEGDDPDALVVEIGYFAAEWGSRRVEDLVWRNNAAPELARRLQQRDQELREVRQALDIGPGEPIDGEIVEAIEELQRQAARAAELEKRLELLKCDAARGQVS